MLNQHKTVKDNIERFNNPLPLVNYLVSLVGDKKEVKIADIGSGPQSKIGQSLSGVEVKIYPSDNQDFTNFYKKHNFTPLIPIEYQDMENLTYPDSFFDIVHCANALDHTKDVRAAVEEMLRACKPEGWIYIDCCLDQMDTGHKHYWNAKEDGVLTNGIESFDLKSIGFNIDYVDYGGERRYNHIIATMKL